MLTVTRNMSKSTIKVPPIRASIDGMFGYSTAVFDDILDLLPPALPCDEDGGNTLGETILIQPLSIAGRLEKSATGTGYLGNVGSFDSSLFCLFDLCLAKTMISEMTRIIAAKTSKRNVEIRGLPGPVGVEGFTVRITVTEWVSGPLGLVVLPAMVIV